VGCAANREGSRKGFFPFFEKGTQTKFKHKFEFNQPKINATSCMQQQTPIFHYFN
jgi:hypothetical protein